MNNLSFVRHAEFIMQLIIFLMGRCDSDRPMRDRHPDGSDVGRDHFPILQHFQSIS
jgi:hypothetical protein